MSIKVMSRVWENSTQRASALLLLLAIADHADDYGENAYPSVIRLARKTRMSERQITRLLAQLEKSGELVIHRRGGGRKRRNVYTVCPPRGKGDKLSGFRAEKGVKKGDNGGGKGDIQGEKGDIAMSDKPSKEPSKESRAKISQLKPPDRLTDHAAWEKYWAEYYATAEPGSRPLSRDAKEAERREARSVAIAKRQKERVPGPVRPAKGLRQIGELVETRGA